MKKYTVYIEQDEDGVYIGSVPSLLGCYAQGFSLDELMKNMDEVIRLCVRNIENEQEQTSFVGVQTLAI